MFFLLSQAHCKINQQMYRLCIPLFAFMCVVMLYDCVPWLVQLARVGAFFWGW